MSYARPSLPFAHCSLLDGQVHDSRLRRKTEPGRIGERYKAFHRLRHPVEQRLAQRPAAEVELDAPAVGNAGMEVHVEMREVAAHLELDVERLREARRVQRA